MSAGGRLAAFRRSLAHLGERLAPVAQRLMQQPAAAVRLLFAAAAVLGAALVATEALARPGGGHTFSGGGGGGYGGGGGGGGGEGIAQLILWLVIRHPKVGIPVAIVAGIVYVVHQRKEKKAPDWATTPPMALATVAPRRTLETLRRHDPDFSTVLFDDFVYALYARAHEARGGRRLDTLAPWLGAPARGALTALSPDVTEVKGVVVGALRIAGVTGLDEGADKVVVRVGFEANYTEVTPAGEQSWYVVEQWHLMRGRGARSRPPERVRTFDCPSCGAALDGHTGAVCSYCETRLDTGDHDWVVAAINFFRREARGPQLTAEVPERGTNRPTIRRPDVQSALARLGARPAGFDGEAFLGRVRAVFDNLQTAWSTREWTRARPYVTDSLFQTQLYWIEAYRKAGLRNVLDDAKISTVDIVAVSSDRWYDAVTVRLFASSLDYTVSDADGRVVCGSRSRPRSYSEYWTFVRGTDARAGTERSAAACPNCGAPLQIAMTGNCEFCGARVTSGEFDWVLSRIEQDDVYTG